VGWGEAVERHKNPSAPKKVPLLAGASNPLTLKFL
jgi:hypothetical protein